MHMNVQMNCQLDLRSNLKRALKTSRNLVAVFLLKTNVPPSSCVDSYLSVLRRSAIHLWHALYSIRIKRKKKKKKKNIQENIRLLKRICLVESSYSENKRKICIPSAMYTIANRTTLRPHAPCFATS